MEAYSYVNSGGGMLLLYVPEEKQSSVREALSKLVYIPFEFELLGSRIIYRDLNHYPPEQLSTVWSRYFVPIADRTILIDRTR